MPCPPVGRPPPGFRDAQSLADTLPLPWAPEAAARPRPWGAPGTLLPAAASPAPTAPPSLPPATPLSSPENQRHEMSFSHTWLYFSVIALLFGKQKQFTKTKQKNPRPQNKVSAATSCFFAEAVFADSQMGQALPAFLCPESRCLTASSLHPQPQERWAEGHRSLWGSHGWGCLWVGKAPCPSLEHVTGCPAAQLGRSPNLPEGLTRGQQTKGSKVSVHHQRQGQRHAACLPQTASLLPSQPEVPGRGECSRHHTPAAREAPCSARARNSPAARSQLCLLPIT